MNDPNLKPPLAKREPLTIEQANRKRTDAYAWLKDENWQQVMQDPSILRADIRAYLEAENAYTKAQLEEPTKAAQDALFKEMRGRIKEDDSSVPAVDGAYAYSTRYRDGGEYPIFVRRDAVDAFNTDAAETILLDGDKEGTGKAYYSIADLDHSRDHSRIAYAYDDQGSEYYTIKVRDVATGKDLPLSIHNTTGDFAWTASSDALFWVKRDENGRSSAVYYRALDSDEDVLVYDEPDPGFFVGLDESESREFLFITANNHTTSEWRLIPANAPLTPPRIIHPREDGLEYAVTHHDGQFYIMTNADSAVDFKVVTAPTDAPGRENWQDLIPHRPGTLLLGLDSYRDFLVRMERENGLPRIVVRSRGSGEEHTIAIDEAAYDLGLGGGYEHNTTVMRFGYASPTTPDQVFDYDMSTRSRTLRKTRQVPSGHNRDDYIAERIEAPTSDGETVPITILRRRDTPIDGTAPLLLYGYGSYGHTVSADFRTGRLSLVDRGFVYAIAHVRGSMAKGYQWYLDGKLDKKINTFTDFIAAGQHLVANGYGAPDRVIGHGGSAGGLLMGATANMAPALFAGIIAAVPFVDVINTMSDESLPLTPPEWPEWGDPRTDPDVYDRIVAYSPYDNVSDQPYPAMLITGGLSDPRVTYWEPAKWAARLRHNAPSGGPYFLKINMDAGHGGASGRFEGLKETALEYAFALKVAGVSV